MGTMLKQTEELLSRKGLFSRWLAVEKALANAQAELGIIPKETAQGIAAKAQVEYLDMDRYDEIYQKTNHPMVSMLRSLEDAVGGDAGQYIHLGATTQDIIDTAMVLALKNILGNAVEKLENMIASACDLAENYADTPMMGRTHNVQALPITFGYKAAIWASELNRCRDRLKECSERILVLQLSGAVGSMVSFGEDGEAIQKLMAEELKLGVPDICWHASRDRYGEFAANMGLVGVGIGRIANEVYSLMGTECGELSEYWGEGRVGSSTMPHKVNPTSTQHIIAKSTHLRYACAEIMELMLVDHERNMQHFIGERSKMEQICLYVSEVLDRGEELLATLVVNEENMLLNLNRLGGLTQSEHIMLKLGKKVGKQNAHGIVGKIAVDSFCNHLSFEEELCKNTQITDVIPADEIHELLDPLKYVGKCSDMAHNVANQLRGKLNR